MEQETAPKWTVVYNASKGPGGIRLKKKVDVFAVDRGEARAIALDHLKQRGWTKMTIDHSYQSGT
jgi:hypothetical protein